MKKKLSTHKLLFLLLFAFAISFSSCRKDKDLKISLFTPENHQEYKAEGDITFEGVITSKNPILAIEIQIDFDDELPETGGGNLEVPWHYKTEIRGNDQLSFDLDFSVFIPDDAMLGKYKTSVYVIDNDNNNKKIERNINIVSWNTIPIP